jgi:hypothetical protein
MPNKTIDDYQLEYMTRCCEAPIIFYDWYRCASCGEFVDLLKGITIRDTHLTTKEYNRILDEGMV